MTRNTNVSTTPATSDATRSIPVPLIRTTNRQLREVTDDTLAALVATNTPPRLFVRARQLVHLRLDGEGRPSLERVTAAQLRARIARVANFEGGAPPPRPAAPPRELVQDLLALDAWPFPMLDALVETPVLRPDGSLLDTPGYDAATRLYYHRRLEVPAIRRRPTARDVQRARARLDDLLADFPFVTPADRAAAVALLLTPFVRPAITGPIPLALIQAPKQGTGKGLLAEVVSLLATGAPPALTSVPTNETEWDKKLVALLRAGEPLVVFDNVTGVLNSAALSGVLTAAQWSGRLLGASHIGAFPNRPTWIATGNQLRVGADLVRRCYPISLDARVERPEQRTGFTHPDLSRWVASQRGVLVHALLTLARAWYAAGRPRPARAVPVMGSFTAWSETLGGILAYAGVEGFLDNLTRQHEEADVETPEWRAFCRRWRERFQERSVTAAEVLKARAAFEDVMPRDLIAALDQGADFASVRLGHVLATRAGTRYSAGGLRLERAGMQHHVQKWRVVEDTLADAPQAGLPAASQADPDAGVEAPPTVAA